MRRTLSTTALLVALFAVSACGGDDDEPAAPASTPPATTTTSTAPTTATTTSPATTASGTAAPSAAAGSPSKAAFLAAGNRQCKRGEAQLEAAGDQLGDEPTQAEFARFVRQVVVPSVRRQISALEALGYPAGDRTRLSAIYAETRRILDAATADPVSIDDDAFDGVNAQLAAYGLTDCADS